MCFTDQRFSLKELVDQSSPPASYVGPLVLKGNECHQLHAHYGSPPGAVYQYDIFLDRSINYNIRRIEWRRTYTMEDGTESSARSEHEVMAIADCGDGVFIPTLIEDRHFSTGDSASETPDGVSRLVVKRFAVNKPLSSTAFKFVYPEHVVVTHGPPIKGSYRRQLWGNDNTPVGWIERVTELPAMPLDNALRKELQPAEQVGKNEGHEGLPVASVATHSVVVTPEDVELAEHPAAGDIVRAHFVLTNTSRNSVSILNAQTGCCTTLCTKKGRTFQDVIDLPPGEAMPWTVDIDTSRHRGRFISPVRFVFRSSTRRNRNQWSRPCACSFAHPWWWTPVTLSSETLMGVRVSRGKSSWQTATRTPVLVSAMSCPRVNTLRYRSGRSVMGAS